VFLLTAEARGTAPFYLVYTPANWSDGLLAEDIRCVLAMLAEAADRADTLSSTC
jgi:hypothetical protein